MTTNRTLEAELASLREAWGIHCRPLDALLRVLSAGRPASLDRLIAETGLSHRSVTEVLARLDPWLDGEPTALAARARAGEEQARPRPGLAEQVRSLVAAAPARKRHLDHVPATPETTLRRAAFLAERYCLEGAHVLFLGDHDLTSLALALTVPGVRVSVADVDDDLLEHLHGAACRLGVDLGCWFADLRLGLPPVLRRWAHVVFTDPPYTSEGVRLFAARGCEALRREERSRLLLCYGYGEGQPALGLKVQAALHGLRLLIEEVLPGFNRYAGAQAIGGASALYVTRPVAGTWRTAARGTSADPRIYSHGPLAVEAPDRTLPPEVEQALPGLSAAADLWQRFERHAAARPDRRPALPPVVSADLSRAPWLGPRLLLANRARAVRMALPAAAAAALQGGWQGRFFGAAYRLRVLARAGGLAVVEAQRREEPVQGAELLARRVVEHPAATVSAALREGLIAAGGAATKNEARALLGGVPAGGARALDLPLGRLRAVAEALPGLSPARAVSPGNRYNSPPVWQSRTKSKQG